MTWLWYYLQIHMQLHIYSWTHDPQKLTNTVAKSFFNTKKFGIIFFKCNSSGKYWIHDLIGQWSIHNLPHFIHWAILQLKSQAMLVRNENNVWILAYYFFTYQISISITNIRTAPLMPDTTQLRSKNDSILSWTAPSLSFPKIFSNLLTYIISKRTLNEALKIFMLEGCHSLKICCLLGV